MKFFVAMMIVVTTLSLGLSTAEAKRVGGGSSIGKQSNTVKQTPAQSQAAKPAAPAAAPAAAPPPKPASAWKGILGGALLGLGVGALFSSMGLGGAMGAMGSMLSSLLMFGLLAVAGLFIYRMWKAKSGSNNAGPVAAGAGAGGYGSYGFPEAAMPKSTHQPAPMGLTGTSAASGAAGSMGANSGANTATDSATYSPWGIPTDFDVPGFLRHAKTHFIRLQAAWDKADVNDVREFTSAEMFAELRLQMQERGSSPNTTDVVSLDAELMGIETVDGGYLASVKFTGMIREADHAPTEAFAEVWNLSKPVAGSGGWVLAGIQQMS